MSQEHQAVRNWPSTERVDEPVDRSPSEADEKTLLRRAQILGEYETRRSKVGEWKSVKELAVVLELNERIHDNFKANLKSWGVIELAVQTGNASLAEYMKHWEARATKAESRLTEIYGDLVIIADSAESFSHGDTNAEKRVHTLAKAARAAIAKATGGAS